MTSTRRASTKPYPRYIRQSLEDWDRNTGNVSNDTFLFKKLRNLTYHLREKVNELDHNDKRQTNIDKDNKEKRLKRKRTFAAMLWHKIKKTAKKVKRFVTGQDFKFGSSPDSSSVVEKDEVDVNEG
jgi:hypothetical protein